tara:strand:- start:687 stop:1517 length:831 start_codon:yes stop_codon:yes gene_type:complete
LEKIIIKKLRNLFSKKKIVIGVVHLKPLPGSPKYNGESVDSIFEIALNDTENYLRGGIDAIIVENHGDIPFSKPDDIGPETVSMMSVITSKLKEKYKKVCFGVNVLANDAISAIAVAKASNASFIRVNQYANAYVANEGIIEGLAPKITRYRKWLCAESVSIFTDVHVKHGSHSIVSDRSINELAKDCEFFDSDVLIATGSRTGDDAIIDEVSEIKKATCLPVLVGSGVNKENLELYYPVSDGFIVASSLKSEGNWQNPVEYERVKSFVKTMELLS